MSDSNDEQSLTAGAISRRKVLSTAGKVAWAVPVITMASAVPAFAASTTPPPDFTLDTQGSTATTGGSNRSVPVGVHANAFGAGTSTATLTVTFTSAGTISGISLPGWGASSTTGTPVVFTKSFSASEVFSGTLSFKVNPSHAATVTVTVSP